MPLCIKSVAFAAKLFCGNSTKYMTIKLKGDTPLTNGLGRGFEPRRVVSLSKNINPSLVLVQPRKICPFITERLLMGRKESNQTNKITNGLIFESFFALKIIDNLLTLIFFYKKNTLFRAFFHLQVGEVCRV